MRIGSILVGVGLAAMLAPAMAAPERREAGTGVAGGGDAVKTGADAWATGNYARALAIWRPLAAAGNPYAQYNLAQAYRLGRGVTVDEKVAQDWYHKAAVQNHPQAQANYGLMLFQNGDRTGALPWLQKAADRGDARAQYVVGTALFNGDLIAKDWVRAYALMTRAAAAGLPPAMTSLAEMDKYVPLNQRTQGTAIARDLERSATLAEVDAENAMLVGSAAPAPGAMADATPATKTPPPAKLPPVKAAPVKPPVAPAASATQPPPPPRSMPKAEPVARPAPVKAAPAPRPVAKPSPAIAPVAGGGWRVQVGAYGDPAAAGKVWDGIVRKTPGLSLRPYLVKAGPVTRLQAGPLASRADANRACARIIAGGAACFPVAAP